MHFFPAMGTVFSVRYAQFATMRAFVRKNFRYCANQYHNQTRTCNIGFCGYFVISIIEFQPHDTPSNNCNKKCYGKYPRPCFFHCSHLPIHSGQLIYVTTKPLRFNSLYQSPCIVSSCNVCRITGQEKASQLLSDIIPGIRNRRGNNVHLFLKLFIVQPKTSRHCLILFLFMLDGDVVLYEVHHISGVTIQHLCQFQHNGNGHFLIFP